MILAKILMTIWTLAVSWVIFVGVSNKHGLLRAPKGWVVRLTTGCIAITVVGVVGLLIGAVWHFL